MKFLKIFKLFESKEELYKKISEEEYSPIPKGYKDNQLANIKDTEHEKIKNLIDSYYRSIWFTGPNNNKGYEIELNSYIDYEDHLIEVEINKTDDDYFYVSYCLDEYEYFLCDTIDGLLTFLEEFVFKGLEKRNEKTDLIIKNKELISKASIEKLRQVNKILMEKLINESSSETLWEKISSETLWEKISRLDYNNAISNKTRLSIINDKYERGIREYLKQYYEYFNFYFLKTKSQFIINCYYNDSNDESMIADIFCDDDEYFYVETYDGDYYKVDSFEGLLMFFDEIAFDGFEKRNDRK